MKKLLALLLCLAFCLPLVAYAEAASTIEQYTVDCGDFTIDLFAGDLYEIAQEKTNNAVYAMFYPAYDEASATHDNFNVVWNEADISATVARYGVNEYAQRLLQATKNQFEAMGIKVADERVLRAVAEDNACVFLTAAELDYTGAGYDLVTPMYQLQVYFCSSTNGTYVFTFSSVSFDRLQELSDYLDYVTFK